jgi:hypothetical protein
MAVISGQDGKLTIATTDVVLITKWDLSLSAETSETTNFDSSGYREYGVIGLKSGTASVEGFLNSTVGSLAVGSSAAAKLYVGASSYYGGTAVVKSVKITNDSKDIIGVSYDLEFTGAITEVTGAVS